MEVIYSKNDNSLINNKGITGIYKDKIDLVKHGVRFKGINYDDEWTVKRFLKLSSNPQIIKMFDDLNISKSIIDKKIKQISSGYLKLVLLMYALAYINDTIYLDYFEKGLSYKVKQRVINYLKNKNKNIVVISNDLIFLNSLCYYLIVFKNSEIVYNDTINSFYNGNIKIEYPEIIKFIKTANKKGANLQYTVVIKDLIKDIYRSLK